MIIRVIAIRELFGKNYKIDLLFFWASEEKVREILHNNKLVALELYEYKKDKVETYWKIKVLIEFEWEEYRTLSNSTEIDQLVYLLSIVGFNVKNINYVGWNKLEQAKINEILASEKDKAAQWLKKQNDIILQNKEKDSAIFDDDKLEKTLKMTTEFLEKVPVFIEKAGDVLSKSEIKNLQDQLQELSKLKMWNNVEKISSFLEEAYENFNTLEQKYLSFQDSPNIDVSGSNITDAYLLSEISKLEKAKNLLKLWWAKTWEDVLYANLWWILLYLKLIKKDFLSKLKWGLRDFSEISYYLTLLSFLVTFFSALYFSLVNKNDIIFVIMICSWTIWLVFFIISFIKKKNNKWNILLLILWLIISIVLIRILKQFFIF